MSDLLLKDLNSLKGFFTDPVFVAEDNFAIQSEEIRAETIETPTELTNASEAIVNFKLVGAYQKGLLILVKDAENEVSNEEGKILLKNILKFLKISSEDFGILNLHPYPDATLEHVKQQLSPKKIFAFGIEEDFLDTQNKDNYFQSEGIRYFIGAALNNMATDVESKKMFNQGLKNYTP